MFVHYFNLSPHRQLQRMNKAACYLIFLLSLSLFGCESTPDKVDPKHDRLVSGIEEGFFVDGPRASRGLLWQDFRIGTWRFYHHNGSKRAIANYSHPRVFSISEPPFGRKPMHLFRTEAHEFLTKQQMNPDSTAIIYREGPTSFMPDGLWIEFDTTGKMTLILDFVNGIIVDTIFDRGMTKEE